MVVRLRGGAATARHLAIARAEFRRERMRSRGVCVRSLNCGVVLVALTGWGQDRDRERSFAAGIEHHLAKPLDPDKLDELLAVLTRR